jgi:TadE-like protein
MGLTLWPTSHSAMWGTDMRQIPVFMAPKRQAGVAAVEFALLAIIFFTFVFGVIEVARAMYVFNTLQEVTRRGAAAAANTSFKDGMALSYVRMHAVFRDSSGPLVLADPITDANVTIDYLSTSKAADGSMSMSHIPAASLPACPARNRLNCMTDPNASNCIRFVRVRVCASPDDSGNCTPARYKVLFSLIGLSMDLPTAPSIVPAASLGYTVGQMPCP